MLRGNTSIFWHYWNLASSLGNKKSLSVIWHTYLFDIYTPLFHKNEVVEFSKLLSSLVKQGRNRIDIFGYKSVVASLTKCLERLPITGKVERSVQVKGGVSHLLWRFLKRWNRSVSLCDVENPFFKKGGKWIENINERWKLFCQSIRIILGINAINRIFIFWKEFWYWN